MSVADNPLATPSHVSRTNSLRIPLSLTTKLRASIARRSLPDFVRLAWPLVEPVNPLQWSWHLDLICDALACVHDGTIKRLIVNIPPGFTKSLLVSVMFPCWEWAESAHYRYLYFSYTDVNTIRDNRSSRDIITSAWYQEAFPHVKLSSDSSGKIRFDTTAKGWRIASSVGGMGTGEHPHRIGIDDPHKAKDVYYPDTALQVANDWFDSTISTRVSLDPTIFIIMQRLHERDMTAHVLGKQSSGFADWHHVCLPMHYCPTLRKSNGDDVDYDPHPDDPRTNPGELLDPIRFPADKVRDMETYLGPVLASGQLEQRPIPAGGAHFKADHFPVVEALPAKLLRCRGWDTANTEGGGNLTAGVQLALGMRDVCNEHGKYVRTEPDGLIYVTDCITEQYGTGKVDNLIIQTAIRDGHDCLIAEGGGSGQAVTNARAKSLAGYAYTVMPENTGTGNKLMRAQPLLAQCEVGNVRVLRGAWNDSFVSQMCAFGVGKFDDVTDAASNAYNHLVGVKMGPKKRGGVIGRRHTRRHESRLHR